MNIFSKRPLFSSCMIFVFLSSVSYFLPIIPKIILASVAATCFICSLLIGLFLHLKHRTKCSIIYVILSSLMATLAVTSSIIYFDVQATAYEKYYGDIYTLNAVVIEEDYEKNQFSQYRIRIDNVKGQTKSSYNAVLSCEYPAALEVGDRITVTAIAEAPSNDSMYNEKLTLLSDGIFIVYKSYDSSSLIITDNESFDVKNSFFNLNTDISRIFTRNIGGEAGNLSSALFLGNRHLLSDTTTRDFSRAGVSHVLALSGLHMSIIMGALMFILKKVISNHGIIAVILSFCALFYLALTGFSVSATRSVIMLLIVYLAMLVKGMPDSLTSLSIAAFIIILISPGATVDAAFWMSFAATLGILVYMPPINEYFSDLVYAQKPALRILLKPVFSVLTALLTGIFAIIPLIAVLCIFIKEISLFSVLSSAILSVPTAAMILLSMLFLPLHSVPYVSQMVISAIRTISDLMIEYCAYVSDMEGIVLSLNYPFATVAAILIGAALIYSFASNHKKKFVSLIPVAICLLLFGGTVYLYENANYDNVKVSYVNSSSTSDLLIVSNGREAVICDVSNGSKTSYSKAIQEVGNARATEIRAIVLTRYSYAHNATFFDVFASEKVRQIWVPYPSDEDEYSKMVKLYETAQKYGVQVFIYKDGDSINLLDKTVIEAYRSEIERSTVPISLISIRTVTDRVVYASPAFNESDLAEQAETVFEKSKYVIFGNKGPVSKTRYTIENNDRLDVVIFADDLRLALFEGNECYGVGFMTVKDKIDIYIDK